MIVVAAMLLGNAELLAGRFDKGDRSGGRGSGGGRNNTSSLPDYVAISGEAQLKPSSTKGYYRATTEFKHVNAPAQDIDWAARLNGVEYPFLAWKKIPSTFANYSFDVLESKICPKYVALGTLETMLDPLNKVAESEEGNNNRFFNAKCPNSTILTRCNLATALMQKKDPNWKPDTGSIYPYPDVTPNMSCYVAVQYAAEMGYMGGYETIANLGKVFNPNFGANRAEVAKILLNAFQFSTNTPKKYFSDVPESDWYYSPVQGLAQLAEKKNKLSMFFYGQDGYFAPNTYASKEWMDDILKYLF